MGTVYLAVDTALDTQVAIKSNRSTAPDSTSQFLHEARLLASLRHPHLPRVTDYFTIGDMQYLVMDYIPGQDLDTLIKEEGIQPLERVLAWADQLGDALSFLHHQPSPIIHRDVKPANVRLNDEGDVVLVDFGIAKVINPSQATTAAASAYTPGYAPPEQYGGNIRTGTYTDQYSLAALIYHLLSGEKPADAIQRALGRTELIPIYQLAPNIPAHLQAALDRALSLKPQDRFADVDDFMYALRSPLPRAAEKTHQGQPASASDNLPTVLEATVVEAPPAGKPAERPHAEAAAPPGYARDAPPPGSTPPPPDAASAGPSPRRKLSLLWVGLLAAACLAALTVTAAGIMVAPRFFPQLALPGSASPQPSQTPLPDAAAITPTISASNTLPATDTPQPAAPTSAPTQTVAPTEAPTDTPAPSATPLAIGGGGSILFASNRGDGTTFQLWLMKVWLNDSGETIGGDLQQLTDSPGDKRQPAWSPDGKRIVYVAPGSKGNDLWVMNTDGSGEPVDITNLNGDEREPAWSPDGQWIAFTSDGRSDKVLQLYLVRPDGSQIIRLSSFQDESSPTWSPTNELGFVMNVAGNKVLYIRGQRDSNTGATPTQAYYVTPVFFDFTALHGSLGQVAKPAWSPDGEWVTYSRLRSNGSQIYLAHYPVRQPEKDILRLTDTNTESSPAWSPDGQWIVFATKRDGNSEIYIMRSTGQNQNNLTLNSAEDVDPAWRQ